MKLPKRKTLLKKVAYQRQLWKTKRGTDIEIEIIKTRHGNEEME